MKGEVFKKIFPLRTNAGFAAGPMTAADHIAFLLGIGIDEAAKDGRLLAEGLLKAQKLYQSDFILVFFDVSAEAEAMGAELAYFSGRNPQPVKLPGFGKIKPIEMATTGRIPELIRAAQICRSEMDDNFPIFVSMKDPFSLAALVSGTDDFLGSIITDPQRAVEILEICLETQTGFIQAIIGEGFIPFIGSPLSSGSILGPEYFKKFVRPYLQKLFDASRKLNSFACLHICGDIGQLSGNLAALKPDILSFEDFVPAMWRQLPETIPMGYVPTEIFLNSDPGAARRITMECIDNLPEPFVLSSGCDLPASAKPELVQAMMACSAGKFNAAKETL